MPKKALLILIPFVLMFLFGLALLLRPHHPAQIVEVIGTFTRQEKTGQRSVHRHTVCYAEVTVDIDGALRTLTVHDDPWDPLAAGDSVIVTKNLFGKTVEYRTVNAGRLMACAAVMGPLCLLLFLMLSRRKKRASTTKSADAGRKPR